MENHHRILHIRIGSKFQLQQTILIFWDKFATPPPHPPPQKKILPFKNRKTRMSPLNPLYSN